MIRKRYAYWRRLAISALSCAAPAASRRPEQPLLQSGPFYRPDVPALIIRLADKTALFALKTVLQGATIIGEIRCTTSLGIDSAGKELSTVRGWHFDVLDTL